MSVPGSGPNVLALKESAGTDSWYVYIVRCSDNSLYTGITTDLERRILEHNSGPRGSRYTRSRRPVVLVYCEQVVSRSAATCRENHIKKLRISGKRQLMMQRDTEGSERHDIHPDC